MAKGKNKRVREITQEDELGKKIREVLVSYIKGQLVIMVLTTLFFFLIFSYLGIRYSIILSIFTGALSIVPVFGMMTAAVITIITLLATSQSILGLSPLLETLLVLVLYIAVNQIIDWVLSPLVIGKTLKIHPLILFISVIIAVSLLGFVGAILAVPTIAVIKVIWNYRKDKS